MKPLFVPLKRQYFDAFASGEKRIEYRAYGPRWHEGTIVPGRPVTLSCGYSGPRLEGTVTALRTVSSDSRKFLREFFGTGVTVAAVHIDL